MLKYSIDVMQIDRWDMEKYTSSQISKNLIYWREQSNYKPSKFCEIMCGMIYFNLVWYLQEGVIGLF